MDTTLRFIVSSASGTNGEGRGELLAFSLDGRELGTFSDDARISDPRGLRPSADGQLLYVNSGSGHILALDRNGVVVHNSGMTPGLNPGGGNLGPDGRYFVGLRGASTVASLPATLNGPLLPYIKPGIVPFVRGFAFAADDRLFVSSGRGPSGQGDDTVVAFAADRRLLNRRFVADPELSPLDLAIGPNGNVFVSSEFPFGAPDAQATVREYDVRSGALVQVLRPTDPSAMRRPRGLRFSSDGQLLYCTAQNEVVAFDWQSGAYLGAVVSFPKLHGQAVALF